MSAVLNLQTIMNEVSSGLSSGKISASAPSKNTQVLTEIQAFAELDPLLADLQKQYLDARGNRLKSQKENGSDDAMTDMAQWVEDSAWCAMQTRYMEVRGDRGQMAAAQRLIRDSIRESEAEERAEKERETQKFMQQVLQYERIEKISDRNMLYAWAMLLLMWQEQNQMFRNHQPSYSFNRLAA